MAFTPLESLKIKVRETNNETFSDNELLDLLEDNENNVLKTAYIICLMKSGGVAGSGEKKIKVGPIEIENFDDAGNDYWEKLAEMYLEEYKKEKNGTSGTYINRLRRADGC